MTKSQYADNFNELAVALPAFIRHPTLRQLAERVQYETLNTPDQTIGQTLNNTNSRDGIYHNSNRTRLLDSLYKTPIADASVLVAITNENRPKLLLTRRAAHMKSHASEISCAGGKYEIGDGNNVVTALREACEETALSPNKVQIVGQLPIQTSKSGMSVRPIVALIAPDLVLVPELAEISRIFWADFETFTTQPTIEYAIEYTMLGQTSTIVTPSWEIEGETVWGLTGMILANLLKTGFDRQLDWYYRVQESGIALDR